MNTTILDGYKALPYGKEFIAWLEEKHILEAFINRVEERCVRNSRSPMFFPDRCKGDEPSQYITLSLYFCQCAEGEQFWRDMHEQWGSTCEEKAYKPKRFTFDVFVLTKAPYVFDAYTEEEAEQKLYSYLADHCVERVVAHELSSVTPSV